MLRTTYIEFQTSTTIIPQENLTSDREIKQHTWQWKDNEECSRNEVLYAILILNDSRNNVKWSTIISRKCYYFFIQCHSTLMWLSNFRKVFTFVMAEIGSWIILVVKLVTLQVLCHQSKNNSPMGKVSNKCWIFLQFPDYSNSLFLLYTAWGLLC